MRRGRIFILLALVIILGVAAAYLLIGRPSGEEEPIPTPEEGYIPSDMVLVVVAAQNIARGSEIPRDAIVLQQMPADLVVETWIAGTDEVGLIDQVSEHRARIDIDRGIPVTTAMITEKAGDLLGTGSDASIAIEPGYTAIAIPMSRLSGIAYALRDGDTVDVLITMLMIDLDMDFQTVLPNLSTILIGPGGTDEFPAPSLTLNVGDVDERREDPLPPSIIGKIERDPELDELIHVIPQENQRPRLMTQRLVEAATVLHVGTFPLEEVVGEEIDAAAADQGIGAPPPQQVEGEPAPPPPPDIITLIVTPQDALALNWAMKAGADLVLTLRAPGDTTSIETITVTLQYLIENYDITVPVKLPYGLEPALDSPIVPVLPNDAATPQEQ